MVSRFLLAVFAVGVFASAGQAQKIDDLQQGVRVRVAVAGQRAVDGAFQSASADSVKIITDGVHLVFPRGDSVAFFRSAGIHRSRPAMLFGTAAGILGAAAGAAIGSNTFKPCDPKGFYDCNYVPNTHRRAIVFGGLVFGASSALIGAVVGAATAGDTWVPLDR